MKLLKKKKVLMIFGISIILAIIIIVIVSNLGIKNGYDSKNNYYVISSGKEVILDIKTNGTKPELKIISTNEKIIPYDIVGNDTKYQLIMKDLSDDCLYQISLYNDTKFSDEEMSDVTSMFIGTKKAIKKQTSEKSGYFDNVAFYKKEDNSYNYYVTADGTIDYDRNKEYPKLHTVFLENVNVDANFYVEKPSDVNMVLFDSASIPFTTKKSGNYYKISFDMTKGINSYTIMLNDTYFMNKSLNDASSVVFTVSSNKYYTNKKIASNSDECFTYTEYDLPKVHTMIITGYDLACGYDVVIPEKINNLMVRSISDRAFYGCGLTSVIIPSSVEGISDFAFANNNLTEIKFNEGIINFGEYAFWGNKLTNLVFPESVKIFRDHAFEGNKLERVEFLGKSGEEDFLNYFEPSNLSRVFEWKDYTSHYIWN